VRAGSERGQSALRIDHRNHAVERESAILRKLAAENDSRESAVFFQAIERSALEAFQGVARRQFPTRIDAFERDELSAERPAKNHLIIKDRRNGHHVRHAAKLPDKLPPVRNAGEILTCAVAASILRCSVFWNPLLTAREIMSAITPAITPTTEITVITEMTFSLRRARR
jgi:hypothetical protein